MIIPPAYDVDINVNKGGERSRALRPKAALRRSQLLTAAKMVFERDGYFETRVAEIAAAAQASHGTFYTYFDSKDDVLAALVNTLVEDTFSASEVPLEEGTAYEHLEATIAHFLATYEANAGMHRILEQVVTVNDDFLAIRASIRGRFIERIRHSVVTRQQHGVADARIDPLHTAHALGGMVQDYAFALYILRQPLDPGAAVAAMTRIWAGAVGIPEERTAALPSHRSARRRRAG